MYKLIVETPQGIQELIEVGEGGSYLDASLVTWDERKDGLIPAELLSEVGGLKRSGELLVVDGEKKAAHLAAMAAKEAAKQAAADARAARKAAIKGAKSANSVAALRAIVLMLAEDLGYEVDA